MAYNLFFYEHLEGTLYASTIMSGQQVLTEKAGSTRGQEYPHFGIIFMVNILVEHRKYAYINVSDIPKYQEGKRRQESTSH